MSKKFWKTSWSVIQIILQTIWLLILLTFVILPRLIVNPLKRVSLKNRMKRKMMKEGMPRSAAKKLAQKYNENLLYRYGSVVGLIRTAKIVRNIEKNEMEIESENNSIDSNHFLSITL
ncbi:MAG TPA: hypothetical protein VMX55_08095 [candidate division Zixibacteria bacterium]|nr:hypothetical protein [candidate division Zixibacteria bacterium]